MMALIWKELRENAKWALIAMLALGGAECFALYSVRDGQPYELYFYDGITLCKKGFLTATTFGCAAVGLMLGLVQILPELKRDRWASLLHRPVARGTIFRGKVIAGVILYFAATGIPLAASVWLVATPGNFGTPFLAPMVQPGIADMCAGVLYYFAGLLLALQRGWLARTLPLFAAVCVTYFILHCSLFRVALEAVAAMAVALCLAGWGAIHNQESLRRRPLLGRLAFVVVIFYGACGLGKLTKSLLAIVVPPTASSFTDYEPLRGGQPIRITYRNDVVTSVENVDGSPVTDPKLRPDRVRNAISYLNTLSSYVGDAHGYKPDYPWRTYRESSTYLYSITSFYQPRLETWFYLIENRSLAGFSPIKKQALAQLGEQGFQPPQPLTKGFAEDANLDSVGQVYCVIQTPRSLQYANLDKRTILDVAVPGNEPIYGSGRTWTYLEEGGTVAADCAILKTAVAVYDEKQALIATLPYQRATDRWGCISVGINPALDRFFIWYRPSLWIAGKEREKMPIYVDEMDRSGAVLKSYTLPPVPRTPVPVPWTRYVGDRLQSVAFLAGNFLYDKAGAALGSERLRERLKGQFGNRKEALNLAIGIAAFSLVLAAVTFVWARRVRMPAGRALLWAAFTLLFNIAGLIVFRLCSDWPRSVPCAACHRMRRIDEAHCPSCGAGWPAPSPSGTEIFDDDATQPLAVAD